MSQSVSQSSRVNTNGVVVERRLTREGVHPFDEVEWEIRDAVIGDPAKPAFEQRGVEFPKTWSQNATNIVAQKYFRGQMGSPERENSVKQMIGRVAGTIANWGRDGGYFASDEDADIFEAELTATLLHQEVAFNSPVWFNVGFEETPQCSACFILSVDDTMESILDWNTKEGKIFRGGSGSGINLSNIRGSMEPLKKGGTASGPVSFMRGADSWAGTIKSGGKTRRAAKMVVLDVDHPDVEHFITCKADEEKKAAALRDAGFDMSIDGDGFTSIQYQNANNSVRVSDEFMQAVADDAEWNLIARTDGSVTKTLSARELMNTIAKAAWDCADPGIQYDTIINRWHTCPESGRINASNPCSEYMHVDDSACNLASINLMKFRREDGSFDAEGFRAACRIFITAQEILVDHVSYPTAQITENSHKFRPLGLGYANLGSMLMSAGLPYDSDEGRAVAAAITAVMHGQAYLTSAEHAGRVGAFDGFAINREPMLNVIGMHREAAYALDEKAPEAIRAAAHRIWDECLEVGRATGFRNSQVTVLAPTGTIAFMMDCDTTGIEPDLALVKYKKLVGGGMIKIVNSTVPAALFKLGYTSEQTDKIVSYIDATGTIEGAPHIKADHLAVFDCSLRPAKGTRSIASAGHLRMMSAAQPFISGAISKTVNMPEQATVEDIMEAYLLAWRLGLKAVAIYRDGSKKAQPLVLSNKDKQATTLAVAAPAPVEEEDLNAPPRAVRHKLQPERASITHKFNIAGHEGYITVGMYPNGQPGEIFVTMAKEGSTVSGLMDSFALATSMALQHGVPLKLLTEKFEHTRFEPSGWSHNPDIGFAKSIMDYIFRWLHLRFLTGQQGTLFENFRPKSPVAVNEPENGTVPSATQQQLVAANDQKPTSSHVADAMRDIVDLGDAPSCSFCGSIMVRNGSCYKCMSCGSTSGCS